MKIQKKWMQLPSFPKVSYEADSIFYVFVLVRDGSSWAFASLLKQKIKPRDLSSILTPFQCSHISTDIRDFVLSPQECKHVITWLKPK